MAASYGAAETGVALPFTPRPRGMAGSDGQSIAPWQHDDIDLTSF
jgi:hypothetical protein